MVNRKENIDLVFRNGLKDFEAAPPVDVWDNIKPAIKKGLFPHIYGKWPPLSHPALKLFSYRLGMNSAIRFETERASVAPTVSKPPYIAHIGCCQ